ncbi:MAG: hypothetical protein V4843_13060 [Pseudomonadota bacterium]
MQRNENPVPQKRAQTAPRTGGVDTSLLYEEFRRQFKASKRPVNTDFRTLVSWVKLGDQRTHLIHSYPAKLLAHIAHFFVQASALSGVGSRVLDPFCGSGTVPLEASMSGRQALVADANPMARLLTRVKTTPYAPEELLTESVEIIRRARRYRTAPAVDIVNSALWYSASRKKQLEILRRAVFEVEDDDIRDFFLVCFSVTCRKLSYADPAISVPVRLKAKAGRTAAANNEIDQWLNKVDAADHLEEFGNICLANIQRVLRTNAEFPDRTSARSVGNDARNLIDEQGGPLAPGSVDLVVTSPPYGSAQKYVRSMSLSLNWLGLASPPQLSAIEQKTIGREHLPQHTSAAEQLPKFSRSFEIFLSKIAKVHPLRARINRTYLSELRNSLREISRVVALGGHAVIVIGNNTVCGHAMATDKFIVECMDEFGMPLELHLTDSIKSRGLLTKRNGGNAAIARESILVFKKAPQCR